MQPIRKFQQLKGTGGDTVTIDITSSDRRATFRFDNVEALTGRAFNHIQAIWVAINTQVDQPAMGGSIIRPDQLYRIVDSLTLQSDDLGTVYSEKDLNGPALGAIAQVVSNGYRFPRALRSNIAAADGDTAFTVWLRIPVAHHCFMKGHQTGQWAGLFRNNGVLEINLAASTSLAAVSTGAALEATTNVRAWVEMAVRPEVSFSPFWVWRLRESAANETQHVIRNLCHGKGLKDVERFGKVAFLAYLTDQNGLGGADGVDNIRRIASTDRAQPSFNLGASFYGPAAFLAALEADLGNLNPYPPAQGQAWPYALGTAVDDNPAAASTALMMPLFWPSPRGQEISKLQEFSGDYSVDFEYAATPSSAGKWLTLECSYLDEAAIANQAARHGLQPGSFSVHSKVRGLHEAGGPIGIAEQQRKLRGIPQKARFGV